MRNPKFQIPNHKQYPNSPPRADPPPADNDQNSKRFGILNLVLRNCLGFGACDLEFHPAPRQRGLTTLELIMGIGLFAILAVGLGALVQVSSSFSYIFPREKLESEVRRIHLLTLEDMKLSLRQAESILASTTVDSVTYTTGTTTLVFRLRSVDASQNIIAGLYDTFIYSTNTTTPPIKLSKRIVPAGGSSRQAANIVLNDMVQSISFAYNSTTTSSISKVQVDLTTQKSIGVVTQGASSTLEITLR